MAELEHLSSEIKQLSGSLTGTESVLRGWTARMETVMM